MTYGDLDFVQRALESAIKAIEPTYHIDGEIVVSVDRGTVTVKEKTENVFEL